MGKLILVSCSKKKENYKCNAKTMYSSALFKKSMGVAGRLCLLDVKNTIIMIISAKYGLVQPYQILEPYDMCLNKDNIQCFQVVVKSQIALIECEFKINEILFLASKKYIDAVRGVLDKSKKYQLLDFFKGQGIGQRLKYLNKFLGSNPS
jgi:hypothetical protein